jgi:glutamate racemase
MSRIKDKDRAIGVFDSGLGGLTVVRELIRQLPNENIIYYGDTARVPYGTKSKESIVRFSKENAKVLLKHKVKMIVVACNSSSSYALSTLRKEFHLPIVGVIKPGAKKAVESTKNNRVGVIATSATINSQEYTKTIKRYNSAIKIFDKACPLFVPLVEEGWSNKQITLKIANEYLSPLKKYHIDTLILGCTHYPLLKGVLKKAMGGKISLVDSAREVAFEVKQILGRIGNNRSPTRKARYKFLISDKPQQFEKIAKKFLGFEINKGVKHV